MLNKSGRISAIIKDSFYVFICLFIYLFIYLFLLGGGGTIIHKNS